jgi:spermidine/putrescine-binding protein
MNAHRVSRRLFLKGTLVSLATGGLVVSGRRGAAAAGDLVIVGWGGAHEESLKKAVYEPFTAATGIGVKQVSATNQLAMLKAQVQNFPSGSHPKTWAELWDLKRFPGRRTGPGWTPRDNFEAAVMAAGVPLGKVYPIEAKLAFAKLAEIKPQMTWWQSGAQFAQLFADEEVTLGYGWGARVVVLAREGKPLAVELNQAILDQTFYAVSKISKNKDAAMKFIGFASQAKPQAERPLLYPHGPTNRKAWAELDAKTKRDVVNYDLPGVLLRNPEWWMDNETALLEQWKKFLAA